MGEAKDKKDNPPPFTAVVFKSEERIAIAQLFDGQTTKSHEDRRKRRRVRQALGILPKIHVFKTTTRIDDTHMFISWNLGRPKPDNGFEIAKKIADRVANVTGETVDYLLGLTDNYETDDARSETLLDIEEKLHAVKDETYVTPTDVAIGIDDPSKDDEFEEETDNEE